MSNRISTAPPKPGIPVAPLDTATGARASARHHWGARRRAVVAALVLLAIVLTVAGLYAWRIISALNDSQGSAIVPLPTMSSGVAIGRTPTATPTPESETSATSTATVRATQPAGGATTPETVPSSTPIAPTSAPTVSSTSTEAAVNISPVAGGPEATAVSSPEAEDDNIPLATSDELSRLDIVQEIVSASMRSGDPAKSSVWQGRTELNILVLGVDRRPDGGDQNSDVIILARVDLETSRVSAVSLPRDLYVDVPGVYTGKINGAYNAGVTASPDERAAGVVVVRDTIYQLYGFETDAYVLVDFNGFEQVIDAVGGVEVTVPATIIDEDYPTIDYGTERVEFQAGRQHMNGDRALKYVRTRNTDSDDARRERQIDVLLALFDQGKDVDSIRRGDEIIVALSDTIQTNLGLEQQLTLARIAREMSRSDITLTTLAPPLISGGLNAEGAWVYSSDPIAVAAFIDEALASGTGSTLP